VYRVGILASSGLAPINDGFKAKMTESGYIENKNITYTLISTGSDLTQIQAQAKALVDQKVDLILTSGTQNALVAKAATQGTNIPVVFAYGQLEGTNLVQSVSNPGGNLTGVRYPGPEMIVKRLDVLLKTAPNVKRVWIGYDKNNANTATALEALRPEASSLGVTLIEVPVTKQDELAADLAARANLADIGMDAMLTMPDSFNTSTDSFAVISKFATDHKIPLAGGIGYMAQQGALFINTTDLTNVGALVAPLAEQILKGIPAGTIPVVTPNQQLIINYKVAQGLGLTVPTGLLSEATQIIR
jgi:putative ABC transport system substrate-binding protein